MTNTVMMMDMNKVYASTLNELEYDSMDLEARADQSVCLSVCECTQMRQARVRSCF